MTELGTEILVETPLFRKKYKEGQDLVLNYAKYEIIGIKMIDHVQVIIVKKQVES